MSIDQHTLFWRKTWEVENQTLNNIYLRVKEIENEKLDTEQNLPQGGGGGDADFGLDSPTKAQTKGKIGSATNFICPKTNFHISFSTSQNLKWIIMARSKYHFWWE